jgi:hypothetical protein
VYKENIPKVEKYYTQDIIRRFRCYIITEQQQEDLIHWYTSTNSSASFELQKC